MMQQHIDRAAQTGGGMTNDDDSTAEISGCLHRSLDLFGDRHVGLHIRATDLVGNPLTGHCAITSPPRSSNSGKSAG